MPSELWENPTWRKLRGWPCIILGNSPALNHVPLHLLDSVFTIGVNRILRIYSPDAVLVVDPPVLKQELDRLKAHQGKALLWRDLQRVQGSLCSQLPNSLFFDLGSPKKIKEWKLPDAGETAPLRVGTTPPYALQLAALAGCNPIGILGVDHSAGPNNGKGNDKSHFYGEGRKFGASGGGPFSGRNERFWKEALGWLKKLGIDGYNLSPFDNSPFNSAGWPRVSLENFPRRLSEESEDDRANQHGSAHSADCRGAEAANS